MSDPLFQGMTNEQLAHWHQQDAKLQRALKELADTRAAAQKEREDWTADYHRLSREVQQATEAAVADRNRFAFVAEHLPPILAQWLDSLSPFADSALTPEFQEQRQRVRELLSYLAPFTT